MVRQYRVFDTHRRWDRNCLASPKTPLFLSPYRLPHTLCTVVSSMGTRRFLGTEQRTGCAHSGSDDFMDIAFADLPQHRADNSGQPSGRNCRLSAFWLGLGERLPDCDPTESGFLSEYGQFVLVICDRMVLLQLRDAYHIRLWRNYAINQDCTCVGGRRSCYRTTLSRCFNRAIDRHGAHVLAA